MTVSRKTTRLITATGTSILALSEASMLFAASPALADECQLEDNSSNASASSGDKSLACGVLAYASGIASTAVGGRADASGTD
ncbi:MAG: hypothetical protein H7251_10225 [Acetobacteraceae bacterium]|nr:hypothetical protein [Acetobacteraceae bacterium]